jgi:PKD repeat protein
MKKIFTLLWLTLAAFTFKATAQTNTTCNAEFTVQYVTNFSVKFNPAIVNDSPFVQHTWSFGDGSPVNHVISPTHTYTLPSSYSVVHTIIRTNPNNVPVCTQTFTRVVTITEPCNLVVDYSWTVAAANPLTLEFHNLTVPLSPTDSTIWNFGDGTTSYAANPAHTYANYGTYNVCLIVKKYPSASSTPCVRYSCKTITVTQPCNIVADFNWTIAQTNLLTFEFHNLSTNLATSDSIRWTFGDGTSSTSLNPVHTYSAAGTYTVCLRIARHTLPGAAPCVREICKTVVVTQPCTLVANFTSQPNPSNPLQVRFTNTSTPLNASDSIRWTFGDGTSVIGVQSDAMVANPVHNYTTAGTFTVCLRVKKNNNTTATGCVREICHTIAVTQPCNFAVNFSWRLDSANVRKVYFTNLTVAPTANAIAVWSFGDGTSATSWNAVHEYAQPGAYRVCLRVYLGTNTNCVRETCDTVIVHAPPPACTQLSLYHFERVANDIQKYKFTPDYINTSYQYTWTFGDGTGSHDPIATHRYAHPGVYTACLTVWRGPDCASTTCNEINVQLQINCDTSHVGYSYQADPAVPNNIHFYANATLPILDQTWTITRLNGTTSTPSVILHQNNPAYLFPDTGYYRVCLRAIIVGGCVKEFCNTIRITQVANGCQLQAFPNPATNSVAVNVYLTQPESIHASVYNSLNVLVLDKTQQGLAGNNVVNFNIAALAAGLYTIRFVYGTHVCYARFQKL